MNDLIERLTILRESAEREDRCGDECAYRDAIKALEAADRLAECMNPLVPLAIKKHAIAAYLAATKKG